MLYNLILLLSALFAAGVCFAFGGFSSFGWLWLLPLGFAGGFLICLLLCFLAVWIPSLSVDPEKQQEEDDPYTRAIVRLYAPAVFRLLGCKIETSGTEKLPREGRFLLVCNHTSNFDPGIPLAVFPDAQLSFISKKENLQLPIIGPMMLRILCQLLDRENDRAALKTILRCISILKEDKASIGVFPEGGIIKDGKLLHHFRPGVFKIAQKANVPIVVCTLTGTRQITANLKRLRRSIVHFHLLEVIPAEELRGVSTVDIADRVHAIMAADLGAENVAS
ncbi:MAG: 1-acyl-sn-glycerol-3-phosphate acyltransferase [Ruminococcaceae bacterium]|nr:1-acyl-sn-glycerol-3-phosphate acyltransferase [Oscillospiraceae bacterium]